MKKFIVIIGMFLALITNVQAEIYHGIDIDAVYNSSDWRNKEDIKQLINDYTLLLEYEKEFKSCPNVLPDVLGCYDKVAEKIVTNLFVYPEHNIKEYKQLKKTLSDAYGLKNCRNKYAWPSGHMCDIDRASDLADSLKKYIQDIIDSCKEKMFTYSPILKEYK